MINYYVRCLREDGSYDESYEPPIYFSSYDRTGHEVYEAIEYAKYLSCNRLSENDKAVVFETENMEYSDNDVPIGFSTCFGEWFSEDY